ncbi:MAG: PEGA domain-containing protein [Wenzhouxiangellaceae bacterium]|nr:PEGA domain-containing protein [Wenzhouxiangellaceae bacterium]
MPVSDQVEKTSQALPVNRHIQPGEYQPPELERRRFVLPGLKLSLVVAAALVLGATLWFVLTMRAVELRVEPVPEALSLSGLTIRLGENWLARPGQYLVSARHPGYRELAREITVPGDGPARFELQMEPLPGRVTLTTAPVGAEVRIDDEVLGTTPLIEHALPGGEYELEVVLDGYQPARQPLEVEGLDRQQRVHIELIPSSAEVAIDSDPPDAQIQVDGQSAGRTPASIRVDAGRREIALVKPGYQTWTRTLDVEGGQPLELPRVELQPAAALLSIRSEPAGAAVKIDGQARGTTPVEVELAPDRPVSIELALAGYETLGRTITPRANTESTLRGQLVPIDARLQVFSRPAEAQLLIDGKAVGRVGAEGLDIELPAREHELELRLQGYVSQTQRVQLDPDQPTRVDFELLTDLEARIARVQPLIRAADGQTLRLVEPGEFTMGTPRGEQGRQANEIPREVELERLFYMGLHEVTNEQFRQFRSSHSSGIIGDRTLDNEQQPVVRVGFDDAAAFCNWLSEKDGLAPAYRRVNGEYRRVRPANQGYRLPSEAEWAWVARFSGGRALKYPWGEGMPPSSNSGNFADRTAADLVSQTLDGYDDGAPATVRVGSYAPNAQGFHDLGGNVSEWMGDGYEIFLNETQKASIDPLGPDEGAERVVRGSSWRHAGITQLRLAWRGRAAEGGDDLGFRIVRYAE